MNGPLFFVSANEFLKLMTPEHDPEEVEVHLSFSLMHFSALPAEPTLGRTLSFRELDTDQREAQQEAVEHFEYKLGSTLILESQAQTHSEARAIAVSAKLVP